MMNSSHTTNLKEYSMKRRKANAQHRQQWMVAYEILTGVSGVKPRDFWDTATYLFSTGVSAEDAAIRFRAKHTGNS